MKRKVPYDIRKSLFKLLPFAMLAFAACKPDPEPDPIPTREVIIDWNWNHLPSVDSVINYAKQPDIKTVTLHILDYPSDGFSTAGFHRGRNYLAEHYFDKSPKVRGKGTIWVNKDNGAQNTEINDDLMGMEYFDSVWFTVNGFTVQRKMDIYKNR